MSQIRRLVPALVATVAVALSGCSDEQPDPVEPIATASTDTPTAEPSAAPTVPTPPDDVARTEQSARAFVAYYWDVINYAQATGDVSQLRAASGPTCDVCIGIADDIAEQYGDGGSIVGGANSITITDVGELTTDDDVVRGYRLEHIVSHGPQTILASDGSADERSEGSNTFAAYLAWVEDGQTWRTDVLELQ